MVTPGAGALLLLLAVAVSHAQPLERQVAPFPVHDTSGQSYTYPFLGGLNGPRPQLVDIDADGDLDLFVQERPRRIMFFENTGTPAAPHFTWRTGGYRDLDVGQWFRFGDLDGDEDIDLLAEQPLSLVRYYRNDGTPQAPDFTLAADTLRDTSGEPISAERQNTPGLAALDCQGPPDLLLGQTNGRLTYYEHVGIENNRPQLRFISSSYEDICIGPPSVCGFSGSFSEDRSPIANRQSQTANRKHGANVVTGADADADGDPDLLWGDFFTEGVIFIENEGGCAQPGLRLPPDSLFPRPDPFRSSGFNAPYLADLDADGDRDLLVGVLNNGGLNSIANLYFLKQTPAGYETRTGRFLYGLDVGVESVPAAGDLDGDGRTDLVLGNSSAPTAPNRADLFALENSPSADAPAALQFTGPLLPDTAEGFSYAPALGDLDGDNDADLLVGTFSGAMAYYRRTGDGFALVDEAYLELPRGNYAAPTLADLDADGDLDLLVGESAGNMNFYRNEGTPTDPSFTLVTERYAELDPGARSQPVLHDIDQDGDLDLFVGTQNAGVQFYRNAGSAAQARFTPAALPFSIYAPRLAAPAFADLDADGDADLVLGNGAGGLLLYRNQRITTPNDAPPATRTTRLLPNRPNPFRHATRLSFRLQRPAQVRLTVYDMLGRKVATPLNTTRPAGPTVVPFAAAQLPSGVYAYVLSVDGKVQAQRTMVKVR